MLSPIASLTSNKNGIKYNFLYKYHQAYIEAYEGETYIFEIWENGREDKDKFSFCLKLMENNLDLKIVDLYPDAQKHYLGKGISIAIIKEAKSIFKKRIISSSNRNPTFDSESRWSDSSTKVWQKLVDTWYSGRLFTLFKVGQDRIDTALGRALGPHIQKHLTRIFSGEAVYVSYSRRFLNFVTGSMIDIMKMVKLHNRDVKDLERFIRSMT